ncbi:MAG: helix-hairpin-helix domain-containing protein [Planctomycetota bacterium]
MLPQTSDGQRKPWIDPRDQSGIYALAVSALFATLCYWLYHGGHRGQLVEIDRAAPREAKFLVDVNSADWPEIIQLPGLGEVLAQRVIADRNDNGPFTDIDDLTRVSGIGAKTLEKIRPYLMPIPKDTDWAAVGNDDASSMP